MVCGKCGGEVITAGRTTHWYECENCGVVSPEDVWSSPENWEARKRQLERFKQEEED